MALNLENLDAQIRELMMGEIDFDIARGRLFLSERLNELGKQQYPDLLKKSVINGNDETLSHDLLKYGLFNPTYPRRSQNGKTTQVKMPSNAHITLAEGEFNRYYMRAVCLRAIEQNATVEVYRAKEVSQPRSESEAKLGLELDPKKLLVDLRANIGTDTALGIPPGPNSGLSIRIKLI